MHGQLQRGSTSKDCFKLIRYLQDMLLMLPTYFCGNMSNSFKAIAIYDTF